jgi:hypothetical protein
MGKYVTRITHKGKEILLLDARGLQEEDYLAAWDELQQEFLKDRKGSLVLIDATGAAMTPATVNKAKQMAAAGEAIGVPDRGSAFVGLTGLQKSTAQLIAKGMGLNAHFSSTVEEAKEWLVKEDGKRP